MSIATQALGAPLAGSTNIGDTTGAPVARVNGLVRAFGGRRVLVNVIDIRIA